MTLEDVTGIRKYAEAVLHSPRQAARYIDRARTEVLKQKRLFSINTSKDGKSVSATCEGSHPEDKYKVQVDLGGEEPTVTCSCPAREKEAVCKHAIGLLLWRAGNLADERLKQRIQASTASEQDAPAAGLSTAPGHEGVEEQRATDADTIAYQAADAASSPADAACPPTATPSPPPAASTVARAGKRRLPASFLQYADASPAKASKAGKEAASKEASGEGKGKAKVQSKLSFQPVPKRTRPVEVGAAQRESGAARHVPRPPIVKRKNERTPASFEPVRCSAVDMLGISDADLLQLCHSAINAAERPANSKSATPAEIPSVAAEPDYTPQHAAGSGHMAEAGKGQQAEPTWAKHSSQGRDTGAVAGAQALQCADSPARHAAAAAGSTEDPALTRATAADHAVAADADAAAASPAAARAAAGTASRPSGSGVPRPSCAEEEAPPARSLLDELLGGFCLQPVILPAPESLVQQHSAAPSGKEPAVSATADSMHSAQRTPIEVEKSIEDTQKSSERNNPDLQKTAQVTEKTLALGAPPMAPMHGSNVRTQQLGQQTAGKKLSLRERMRLLKGSE